MGSFEKWIASHRRRLSFGTFLATFADAVGIFLLSFGTVVLVVKLARPDWWPHVLWLGVGAIPVTVWAWYRSRRNDFSRSQAVALLDRKVGAGGLVMTLAERYDDNWAEQLAARVPDWRAGLPRLRPVRTARRLWLPLVFAVGCCCVPAREARTETLHPNIVGNQVADSLAETLSLLRENEVLEQKEAEQLQEAIQKLADGSKEAPLTHESWEVVDALRDTMRVRAEDALTAAAKAGDALQSLAHDATKNGETLTAERREQLEKEATESLRKLSKSGRFGKASPQLQKKLQQLMKNGRLGAPKSGQEREKLLSDLKQFLDKESKKLSQCRGQCKGEEGESESETYNTTDHSQREGSPGRGGVTRGRADAKLTWGDEAEANGAKFKEVVLPPGMTDRPDREVIAQSATAPEVDPAASAARSAPRTAGPETGRQTWNRTLRPRHRAVVRNYFETPGPQKSGPQKTDTPSQSR